MARWVGQVSCSVPWCAADGQNRARAGRALQPEAWASPRSRELLIRLESGPRSELTACGSSCLHSEWGQTGHQCLCTHLAQKYSCLKPVGRTQPSLGARRWVASAGLSPSPGCHLQGKDASSSFVRGPGEAGPPQKATPGGGAGKRHCYSVTGVPQHYSETPGWGPQLLHL